MRGAYLRLIPFLALLALGSIVPQSLAQQLGVVPWNATWRFDQTGTDLTQTTWAQRDFDDSAWEQGTAIFRAPVAEALPAGQTGGTTLNLPATISYNAVYFRTHFTFNGDPSQVTLQFSNILDDGAIFFINGEEVRRVVMPAGAYDNTTRSTRADDLSQHGFYDVFAVPGSDLFVGDNVLAVTLFQGGATSSDSVFGLAMNIIPSFGPVFTNQPASATVIQGRNHTLSGGANGLPTPTYQWFFGGNPIDGALANTYTISNMTPAQAGGYFVRATGASGSVDSQTATITYQADDQPPVPVSAAWTNANTIVLTFNEAVTTPADDPFSYSITNAAGEEISVGAATVAGASSNLVVIQANANRDINAVYYLVVLAGADIFGNVMEEAVSVRVASPFILLPFSTTWQFNQTGADLGTAWRAVSYDTTGWLSGAGVLAQEPDPSADLAPLLGADLMAPSEGGPITIYFRTSFNIASTNDIVGLSLRYFFDDAIVVYLNGVEVLNRGVPVPYTYQTLGADHEETGFSGPEAISLAAARNGVNVLAVELHNLNATSSDAVWGGEVTALGIPPTGPPVFSQQPVSQTNNEYSSVTFSVNTSGAQPITYQWQRNTVNIQDATNATLNIQNLHPTANNGSYRVIATNIEGTTTSTAATLTVTPDTTKPTLVSAVGGTNLSEITLVFSETLSAAAAQNIANYAIALTAGGGALTINSAVLTNGNTVILTTSARTLDANYKVTINNVADNAETGNAVVADTMSSISNTTELISEFAVWRFEESNTDLGTAWRAPGFVDTGWSQGAGNFGVEPDAATRGIVINTPLQLTFPGQTVQTTTYYFRNHFTVADATKASVLLRLLYDDGIVVYINGTETWRSPSMASANPITNATFAVNREGERFDPINIGNTNIVNGDNVIAIELHQTSATSTDVLLGVIVEALSTDTVSAPRLSIRHVASGANPAAQIEVSWNATAAAGYVLVESATANGAYAPVAGNPTSPYVTTPIAGATRFYQLRKP